MSEVDSQPRPLPEENMSTAVTAPIQTQEQKLEECRRAGHWVGAAEKEKYEPTIPSAQLLGTMLP